MTRCVNVHHIVLSLGKMVEVKMMMLLLREKVMTNLDNIMNIKNISMTTKIRKVKAIFLLGHVWL